MPRKQKRRAAVQADLKRIEADMAGKSEIMQLKSRAAITKLKNTRKHNTLLGAIEEETPGIQEIKQNFEVAFEDYSSDLLALMEMYRMKGDEKGQDRMTAALGVADKKYSEANERYRNYVSKDRSSRSNVESQRHYSANSRGVYSQISENKLDRGSVIGTISRRSSSLDAVDNISVFSVENIRNSFHDKVLDSDEELLSERSPSERDTLKQAQRDLDALYITRHKEIAKGLSRLDEKRSINTSPIRNSRHNEIDKGLPLPEENQSISVGPIKNSVHRERLGIDMLGHNRERVNRESLNRERLGIDMWRQLNRVSIPTFSGDKKVYASWRAAFYSCVDAAPATPEYKLLQLRNYLKGDALRVVDALGYSAMAYEAAKERLDRKFGGERRKTALRLEELDNFRPMRDGSAKEVDKFADVLDLLVINLKEAGQVNELGNGSLYFKILKKMTEPMIANYKRWIDENSKLESVEVLRKWIVKEAEFKMIASETLHGLHGHSGTRPHSQTYYEYSNDSKEETKPRIMGKPCCLCSETHPIWKCSVFLEMDVKSRWDTAKEYGLCFRCLSSTHRGLNCRRPRVCGIEECKRYHSRFLHEGEQESPTFTTQSNESEGNDNEKHEEYTHTTVDRKEYLDVALRTVPVVLRNGNKFLKVNALLDDGSTRTYINCDVAAELEILSGKIDDIVVSTLGGSKRTIHTEEVTCEIESVDGKTHCSISAFTTKQVTGEMKAVEWMKLAPEWDHLRNLPFAKIAQRKTVDILIGVDHADLHTALKEVRGKSGEPLARLTPLGWTCVGNIGSMQNQSVTLHAANFSHFANGGMIQINRLLERFWELEEPTGTVSLLEMMSANEEIAYNTVTKSIKRTEDDERYQVSMPWKEGRPKMSSNIEMARKRMISTEKHIKKRQLSKSYDNIILNYVEKGYIRKVSAEEQGGGWYLPHFAISRPDKTTSKTRIVFDASARYAGSCLNDHIHKGPKLQRDLNEVLLRFRKSPIAIMCDVAEMYLQIELAPEDRSYHRFLWRNSESREPDEYEFNRLVFGINSCPFQAQLITRFHAEKYKTKFPQAADSILHSTYMDDTMDSTLDVQSAISLYHQLSELWTTAGMHARKWISNSSEVLQVIPKCDRLTEIDLTSNQLPSIKTLGILWKADEDSFAFTSTTPKDTTLYTKRNFLSCIASLFDPLGMLAPFIIRAKVLMQEVWLTGLGWDELLSNELSKKIRSWFSDLKDVTKIRVPRCLCLIGGVKERTVHFFSDASEEAYATVGYLRCVYINGTVSVRQIISKSKVAPLKTVSIPRLELLGASLSVKVAPHVAKSIDILAKDIYYWTDSQNVLWWITKRSRIMKTFVANRIADIQRVSNPVQWHHVPTKENPSDLATRGMKMNDLVNSSLWWNGPNFLMNNEISSWPKTLLGTVSNEAKNEQQKKKRFESYFLVRELKLDNVSRLDPIRYSSLIRLVRITAWIFRFIINCHSEVSKRIEGELQVEEISDSEDSFIITTQMKAFSAEFEAIKAGKVIKRNSKLIGLQPFIDDSGLLRANSRLQNADYLSFETRNPIILPRRDRLTKLIVRSIHCRSGHIMGTNHTLALLSERFWILNAREEIRETENECNKCIHTKAKAGKQIMAPLPKIRLKPPFQAFSRVAVDYAGPFTAIQGRGRKRAKRYLCLFTCLMSRAVHLEIAFSLDTDSFLNAFYRMVNRRGLPTDVLSDNGSNFISGERELRELVETLDKSQIVKRTADKGIKWTFNPPLAPHFGGVHESMIKSAKKAFYAILENADVNDEELMTAFTGAEDLMNSRPLTYQSANPKDDLPLTPNHFLHGRVGGQFAASSVDMTGFNARKRWRRVQELVRHFWGRWLREWLPTLRRRNKWNDVKDDMKVEDMVLVIDPNSPRGQWTVGRIEETYPGADGHVRTAKVRMRGSSYIRPISKLCPMELSKF